MVDTYLAGWVTSGQADSRYGMFSRGPDGGGNRVLTKVTGAGGGASTFGDVVRAEIAKKLPAGTSLAAVTDVRYSTNLLAVQGEGRATTADIVEVTSSWDPSTATYTKRTATQNWTTPGGDFAATAVGSIEILNVPGQYSRSSNLVALMNSSSVNGIALRASSPVSWNNNALPYLSEGPDGQRPFFEVTYTVTSGPTTPPSTTTTSPPTTTTTTATTPPTSTTTATAPLGGGPVNLFYSGHSLLDQDQAAAVSGIAQSLGRTSDWNQQVILGSPVRYRTRGADTGVSTFPGYSTGTNRDGSNMNVVSELRNPSRPASMVGQKYQGMVLTERHDLPSALVGEDTIRDARHYHDQLVAGDPAAITYLYQSWYDIDRNAPVDLCGAVGAEGLAMCRVGRTSRCGRPGGRRGSATCPAVRR